MSIEKTLLERLAIVKRQAQTDRVFRVFVLFEGPFEELELGEIELLPSFGGMARGKLTAAEIETLSDNPRVLRIELPPREEAHLKDSVPSIEGNLVWNLSGGMRGEGVVVAVIDSGIDVKHESFRNEDGTSRIIALWDQTFDYNAAGDPIFPLTSSASDDILLTGAALPRDETGAAITKSSNRTPATHPTLPGTAVNPRLAGFDYGAEFTRDQINTALTRNDEPTNQAMPISLVDNPAASNHGTHVTGIAAGDGSPGGCCHSGNTFVGVAPKADIIVVKAGLDSDGIINTADAMEYVLGKVRPNDNDTTPVVMNLSLGRSYGAHNGFASSSVFMTNLLASTRGANGVAIVRSAGNDRNDDAHAAVTIGSGSNLAFDFNVPAATSSVLFWMSFNTGADFDCTLTLPGTAPRDVTRGIDHDRSANFTEHGHRFDPDPETTTAGDPDEHASLSIRNATASNNVRSGDWTITITNNHGADDLHLHLWAVNATFLRPSSLPASSQGRDVPENWLKSTLGVDASCPEIITVAAYDARRPDIEISDFSSQGPAPMDLAQGLFNVPATRPNKPDISAPGVAIMSSKAGAFASDGCCGCCASPENGYISMNGTSQASPHIAGVVALMLQADPTLTHAQIKTMLTDNIDFPPDLPPGWPDEEELYGAGAVNAVDAVQAVLDNLATARQGLSASAGENPLARHPIIRRISDAIFGWEERFGARPAWHFFASLVGTHFLEVQRLINTQRKVGAVWQRNGGPMLVRSVVFAERDIDPPIPSAVGDKRMDVLIDRLIPVLRRFAGPRLLADIDRFEGLARKLPGQRFDDIDALVSGGRA